LKKLTKQQLIDFYEEKILSEEKSRRICVLLFGCNAEIPEKLPQEDLQAKIHILKSGTEVNFKRRMALYPARLS
jgi:hypothetical protein